MAGCWFPLALVASLLLGGLAWRWLDDEEDS